MKQKSNNNLLKNPRLEKLITICLVVLLFIFAAYLLIQYFQNRNETTSETITKQKEYKDIQNNNSLSTSKFKITIPQNFTITANYINPADAEFNCTSVTTISTLNNCYVYEISSDSNRYYATLNSPILEPSNSATITKTEKLTLAGQEYDLVLHTLEVVKRSDESEGGNSEPVESQFVRQAYICLDSEICFSSGVLDLELAQNLPDFAQFKTFLGSLIIEAK